MNHKRVITKISKAIIFFIVGTIASNNWEYITNMPNEHLFIYLLITALMVILMIYGFTRQKNIYLAYQLEEIGFDIKNHSEVIENPVFRSRIVRFEIIEPITDVGHQPRPTIEIVYKGGYTEQYFLLMMNLSGSAIARWFNVGSGNELSVQDGKVLTNMYDSKLDNS